MDIIESRHVSMAGECFGQVVPCLKSWGEPNVWYIPATGEYSLGCFDCEASVAARARKSKLAQFREYAAAHGMDVR